MRKLWTLRRKIHWMLDLRRNLSAGMNSGWSTKGPNFVNKSLVVIYSQVLPEHSKYQEKQTNSQLPTLYPACLPSLDQVLQENPGLSCCQWTETYSV